MAFTFFFDILKRGDHKAQKQDFSAVHTQSHTHRGALVGRVPPCAFSMLVRVPTLNTLCFSCGCESLRLILETQCLI